MTLKSITLKDFGWRMLLTFLMLVPLYYSTMNHEVVTTLRLDHEQLFQMGVTFLFVVVFVENLWLALFIIWSMFIYAYYNFPAIGGNYVMNLFMAAILYQVTYKLVNRERVRQIFLLLLSLYVIHLLFTVAQIFNLDPLFRNLHTGKFNYDPVGIMGLKAVSGVFAAICIPVAMFFSPWLTLAILPALILSQCSSAVLATVVSILFLAWHRSKQVFLYLMVPIVIMGGVYIAKDAKANMMTDRASLWRLALSDALTRPLVGMGLDSFRNVGTSKPYLYFKNNEDNSAFRMGYNRQQQTWIKPAGLQLGTNPNGEANCNPWDNPHNEFVSIIYEFGMVGFLIFLAFLWDIGRRLYRDPLVITLFTVFLVYLVSSIGQFPFHLANTAHIGVVLLACYYKLTEKGEEKCLLSR